MQSRTLFHAGIAVMLLAGPAKAQDSLHTRVDNVFAAYSGDVPGCAVGVYRDGSMAYARGYGLAHVERRTPIVARSVFDLGSTSKQFTAAGILLLEQDGRLSLDDDVRTYIPELPDYGSPITIRHLLHHTSGLRDYISLLVLGGASDEGHTTAQQALDAIARQRALNFQPGTQHHYSNTGYFLLSQIIERVSGKSMAAFAEERIFRPLGMTATYILGDTSVDTTLATLGYAPAPGGFRTYMSKWEQTGDGAVHSSVEDLLRWDENFYNPVVGGAALVRALQQVDTLADGTVLEAARGLFIDRFHGERRVSHGGAWAGYRAELMRLPDRHLSVAVLCNTAVSNPSALAEQVLDVYLGMSTVEEAEPLAPPARVTLPESELRRWAGRYRNPVTGTLRPVAVEGGRLMARFGATSQELVPVGAAEFVVDIGGNRFTLQFEDGAVPGTRRMRQFADGVERAVFEELESTPVTEQDSVAFIGHYFSEELAATFVIERIANALRLRLPDGSVFPIEPLTPQMLSAGPFTLHIRRGADGNVSGFDLDEGRARGIVFQRSPESRSNDREP